MEKGSLLRLSKDLVSRSVIPPLGKLTGAPVVHVASPLVRGGNFLYYWLWADRNNRENRPARVQFQPSIDEWIDEFPLAARLTSHKEDLSRIRTEWISGRRHRYGIDFDRSDVRDFARRLIESSPRFRARQRRLAELITDDTIVLNIRRGDYYQHDHLIRMYGLDNQAYIPAALRLAEQAGRASETLFLVSDDVEWCRTNIAPLLRGRVVVDEARASLFDDLAALSLARTSVISNSTFSFWGAFLADTGRSDFIGIAPPYHLRDDGGHRNREAFDPDWLTVEMFDPGSTRGMT